MADPKYISQITLPNNETYNLKDSAAARVSHTHGNLTNDGKITSTATIASGDKLVIVDSDSTAGSKITGSSITFGTSTAQWLNNSGKWSTPTASQIGAATTDHTHTLSLATDTGTSSITLAHGGKYKLTAGGNSVIFTLPSDNNTTYTISSSTNNGQITVTPSSGDAYNVSVTGLGSAAYRGVDSSIGAASTSNNLPTSAAVASFVEGKGYVTSSGVTQITAGSGLSGGTITTTGTISIATGGVSNDMLAGSIANGKLANSAISIAGTSVSLGGSLAADTLRTNLGLSNALHFRGIATVAITDGSTTNPTISGYDFSKKEAGDVIIDKDSAYEFIWSGSKWERLGPDGSYKTLQTAVTDANASTSATTTFVQAVTQDANGAITVTKAPLNTSGTWTGTANNAINAKYLMNRGANTITIADSNWPIAKTPSGHTNREIVWGQKWTQSGLTYTPSGGSATNNTDTADLRLWLSSSNTSNVLQLNAQIDGMIYALGGFQGNLVGNVIGNVIGSSGSCTGNAATATKFNSARKIELTGAVTGSVTTDGSNGWTIATTVNHNHDSLTKFVVSEYSIPAIKGVRIQYPSYSPVLISAQRSNNSGRLILIGGGYGNEGTIRNDFTEVVSPSESIFTWSLPNTADYDCALEVMNHSSGEAIVKVWTSAACTFTQIDALTTAKQNHKLLTSLNYNAYAVAKSAGVTNVAWDSTNSKITKTINGTTSDVVTIATLKSALGNMPPASHDHNTLYLTAIGYDKSTKKIYYTKNGSNTNILEFAAGNNISLSAEDNKLTITNTYSATNKAASLSWGQTTTIATVGGTDITVTLPSNPDSDTKVTNTLGTTTKFYITGTTTSTTNTGTQYFDTGVYVSATAGELVATKFTGALNGTANVANKLGTADKGSTTKPIYLAAGVATECSTYAGGTAVTLNGTSKAASTASFYAPTSAGSNTQILVGGTPSWVYPGISIGAGTSSTAPTIGFTTSTSSISAQSITIASTSVYGVTKLQDGVSSTSTVLAATANAAKTASTSATHTLATTTKFFVTGCTSSTTNTAGDDFDTGVYVTTTAGEISALRHSWHDPSNSPVEKVYSYWNPNDQSIDFVFN